MRILNKTLDSIREQLQTDIPGTNVGASERALSVIAGGFILGVGVKNLFRSPLTSFSGIVLGGGLILRGITGRCKVTAALKNEMLNEQDATVIEHRYFVK